MTTGVTAVLVVRTTGSTSSETFVTAVVMLTVRTEMPLTVVWL